MREDVPQTPPFAIYLRELRSLSLRTLGLPFFALPTENQWLLTAKGSKKIRELRKESRKEED